MNSQNSPHCCLPCVDNCVLIALMSCKRKRTKSTSCENKTKVKVADPCSLRSSAPTTIATALASSRGSSDVPDGVCTPSHDVALLIQRCDSVLAQHGAQGADQHLAAPRRVHARGLGGEQEVSASGIAQDGWAPGHSDDDTFTHILPGARAVHRRVRVVRAAVAQSGLTFECASEELRGDREVVVVDAVLDGVQTTRLASRCGISTRRAWHLDAASQGVGIVASPRVSRVLLYYFHIYFIRSLVFPLFGALIVCILLNAAFYMLLSMFYVFIVHLALLLSLVTFASTHYLYIVFSSFVPL